jgi:hypothetical protein
MLPLPSNTCLGLSGHDDREHAPLRIETADTPVAVAGIPDHSLRVHVDAVWIGPFLDLIALELLVAGIEPRDVITGLADEPDLAVGRHRRVAGAAAPFDRPLLEVDIRSLLPGNRRLPRHQRHGACEHDQSHRHLQYTNMTNAANPVG